MNGPLRFFLSLSLCLATTLVLVGCTDGSDDDGRRVFADTYPVAVFTRSYVDIDRVTPASGEFPALETRTLETTVFMPQGDGPFPLLIFSHGLGASPLFYEVLLREVAAAGFVIAAPLYPLTGNLAPAGPDGADTQNQPADVSFLVDSLFEEAERAVSPFFGRIDRERLGTFGHSNGGITTLGIVGNSCCRDRRIDAAISMAATAAPFNGGTYDFASSKPLLLIHGTLDALIPFNESVRVFNQVVAAKGLLTLADVGHSDFLAPAGHGFDTVVRTIRDFFRTHLRDEPQAEARLQAGSVVDVGAELLYTRDGGTDVTLPLPPPITDRVATVEPASDLVDGQVVTVAWRNFEAGNVINILQCSQGGLGGSEVCDFANARILQPNPTGEGSLTLEIIIGQVGSGRCEVDSQDCVVVVNDGGSTSEEATLRIPISFSSG